MRKAILEFLSVAALSLAVSGFGLFVFANVMLGCESWDRSTWTVEHSCVAPSDVLQAVGDRL